MKIMLMIAGMIAFPIGVVTMALGNPTGPVCAIAGLLCFVAAGLSGDNARR